MKTIEQIEKDHSSCLVSFMIALSETHFDGIHDAIENYFVEEGYFDSADEGLDYYDNH
jgi:hypothetical protein